MPPLPEHGPLSDQFGVQGIFGRPQRLVWGPMPISTTVIGLSGSVADQAPAVKPASPFPARRRTVETADLTIVNAEPARSA